MPQVRAPVLGANLGTSNQLFLRGASDERVVIVFEHHPLLAAVHDDRAEVHRAQSRDDLGCALAVVLFRIGAARNWANRDRAGDAKSFAAAGDVSQSVQL